MSVPGAMRRFDARLSVLPEEETKVQVEATSTAEAIAALLRRKDVQQAMDRRPTAGVVIGCFVETDKEDQR